MTNTTKHTKPTKISRKAEEKVLVFEQDITQEIIVKKDSELSVSWKINSNENLKIHQKFILQEGSVLRIKGLYDLKKETQILHEIQIHHIGKNSQSETELKSVLDDQSRLNLTGQINVEKDCTGINSNLLHKTILLSKQAKVKTQPELRIKNNDVKCKHGATIGSLDEQAIAYMQSRGLSKNTAKEILVEAFLNDENLYDNWI